jgi:hypothetical protein
MVTKINHGIDYIVKFKFSYARGKNKIQGGTGELDITTLTPPLKLKTDKELITLCKTAIAEKIPYPILKAEITEINKKS